MLKNPLDGCIGNIIEAMASLMIFVVRTRFVLCVLLAGAFSDAFAEPVHIQLRWHHQFQFAGYYVALEKGFYRKAGLEVILDAGSPDKKPVQRVLQGRAQYGVANSELLLERLRGARLVALAAIYQHSPSVLLARKDAGILSPHDLIGKKVMLMDKVVDADFFAMMHNEGISMADLHVIPSSFNIQDLVDGKVVAFNSYLSNEPYYLKQHGVDYTVLNPRNYGVDFYSDILFTTESEIKKHPGRVKVLRDASLEGWRYAMDHPQEVIDLLVNKYKVNKSRAHLEFEAQVIRPLIVPDLIEMGHMNPWRWQHMANTFMQAGMVENDQALNGFMYDPDFKVDREQLWLYSEIFLAIAAVVVFVIIALSISYRTARREIRLRLAAEEEIRKIAYRDMLTGLDNRHHLFVLADQFLKMAQRDCYKVAVCFIDLNQFKDINDTLGHKAGDKVLVHVGQTLRNFIRQSDVAVRFGGDEFILLLNHVKNREDVTMTLVKIQQAIGRPVDYQDKQLHVSASMGVAFYPDDGTDIDALIDLADSKMYRVKLDCKRPMEL
ncbi:GGDEF domain-containing protein [Methylobacter sp. BBA5.1]|uniref:GGDEF domain-containing protein n=1 Tax=Methylobacter sp. BBA5.1 TaxID=1495064 RepID=UPI00068BEDCA|nr:GGDEF domain-containing protein [Methylobacter sp. BBA5.1]